jgi:hypothetical protein
VNGLRLRAQDPRLASMKARLPREVDVPSMRDIPPVLMQPSQPGALGAEQGIYVRLPGANYPPAGAVAVDVDGDANIAPGASAVLVSVVVPDTVRFKMVGIGFGADDEVALRFLTWAIKLNDVGSPGYTQKNAVIGTIVQLALLIISVGSSQTVTVVGTADVTAVVTYRYICRFQGYFYADKEGA